MPRVYLISARGQILELYETDLRNISSLFPKQAVICQFFHILINNFIHPKIICRFMSHKEAKKAAALAADAKVESPKATGKHAKKN